MPYMCCGIVLVCVDTHVVHTHFGTSRSRVNQELISPSSPAALAQLQPTTQPPSCLEPPAPPAHAGRRTARRGAPLAWLRGDAHWERVDAHGMI